MIIRNMSLHAYILNTAFWLVHVGGGRQMFRGAAHVSLTALGDGWGPWPRWCGLGIGLVHLRPR